MPAWLGLLQIGQKEDPDFTFRDMVVQVLWPGASLTDMQDQVVNKIERKLQETPHLDFVRSFTRAGSAIITVQIKGDTSGSDVTDAFYQVRKKVGDIASDLPSGIYGPYFNDEFGDTFITLHAITGDGYSFPELKTFATAARDVLLRVPGVEKVVILGDQPQKLYIDVSSKVLAERGISVLDIQNALTGQNAVDASGRVETGVRSVRITVGGEITRPEDLADLRLKIGGQVVRLGDIATVTRGLEAPFTRKFRFDGKDAVEIGVVMAKGFNVTTVGADVHKTLADFAATLPAGVEVGQISDQPAVVTDAITEFCRSAGRGARHRARRLVHLDRLACRPGRGDHHPARPRGDLRHHVRPRHRSAAHLARRADHRARPARRRCDDRGRDDGTKAAGGPRPSRRGKLRLPLDRLPDADRNPDHHRRLHSRSASPPRRRASMSARSSTSSASP